MGTSRFFGFKLRPQAQRKVQAFSNNMRAFISLYIFMTVFFISLFAEFIANDKPIIIRMDHKIYFPIWKHYTETEFGGLFDLEPDYHDPYIQEVIQENNGRILWPVIPFKFNTVDYYLEIPAPSPPSSRHWLGTDDGARDVLANIIYGFRISVIFGLFLTIFSSIIGVAAGAVQGYFGGKLDLIFQRVIELWVSIPLLYLIIIITSIIRPTFFLLLIVLLLF